MKTHTMIVFLMLLNFLLIPSSFAEESAENAPPITNSLKTPLADAEFNQHGYYTFRPDLRLCVSPLCGGIFVKSVNRNLTRCADGRLKAECYVASISNKNNFDINSAALLHGVIKPKIYRGFGNLGIFELKTAFTSATTADGKGRFVGLENNGIVCITAPCFSIDQYLLNKNKLREISSIDLEPAGASKAAVDKAFALLANGGTLIASGINKQVEETGGIGITFVADQFYLPGKTLSIQAPKGE